MSEIDAKTFKPTKEEEAILDAAFRGNIQDLGAAVVSYGRALFGSPASEGGKVCGNCGKKVSSLSDHITCPETGEYYCPPASEPAKVEPVAAVQSRGVWRCECCAEIADPTDPRFRWNGECWQHHHAEGQTHFDCRFFGPKPEPVAAEMPEAVRDALKSLRAVATLSEHQGILYRRADALESFWRTHAAQPAPAVAMTEELETILRFAYECAAEYGQIRTKIAAVRAQAAEAEKVRMPKVRELILAAHRMATLENCEHPHRQAPHKLIAIADAALAELDAAEGKVAG